MKNLLQLKKEGQNLDNLRPSEIITGRKQLKSNNRSASPEGGAFMTGVNLSDNKLPKIKRQNSPEKDLKEEKQKLLENFYEINNKRYKKQLEQIYFKDRYENIEKNEQINPTIQFFKLLARKPTNENGDKSNRLQVWVPDTIVFNDTDGINYWLYTSKEGLVYRTDNFNNKHIQTHLGNKDEPNEVIAVIRKAEKSGNGSDIKLVCSRTLFGETLNQVMNSRDDITILQRFIRNSGPKCYVVRSLWRRGKIGVTFTITNNQDFDHDDPKLTEVQSYEQLQLDYSNNVLQILGYVLLLNIVNKQYKLYRYCTNPRVLHNCQIVEAYRGAQYTETQKQLQNLADFLQFNVNAYFEEIVGDFIKDEQGIWWMINVRDFKLKTFVNIQTKNLLNHGEADAIDPMNPPKKKNYKKVKMCKYCETIYTVNELNQFMTLKMIMQTDKHLRHRGKSYAWLDRSDVKHLDLAMLYQAYPVCISCYTLYQEIEKLMSIERQFAEKVGLMVNQEESYNQISIASKYKSNNNQSILANRFVNRLDQSEFDPKWCFNIPLNSSLIVMNNEPRDKMNKILKELKIHRFMILLHVLRDVPDVQPNQTFSLEYTIFNQKTVYKIDFDNLVDNGTSRYIFLNRIRVFYFFADTRDQVKKYIEQQQSVFLKLYCDNTVIGDVTFDLREFLSDKVLKIDLFKFFNIHNVQDTLQWGLNISAGLVDGKSVSIDRIPLTEHKGVYVPNHDYYNCEPFPQEWMAVLNEKQDVPQFNVSNFNNSQKLNNSSTYNSKTFDQQNASFKKNQRAKSMSKSVYQQTVINEHKDEHIQN